MPPLPARAQARAGGGLARRRGISVAPRAELRASRLTCVGGEVPSAVFTRTLLYDY